MFFLDVKSVDWGNLVDNSLARLFAMMGHRSVVSVTTGNNIVLWLFLKNCEALKKCRAATLLTSFDLHPRSADLAYLSKTSLTEPF